MLSRVCSTTLGVLLLASCASLGSKVEGQTAIVFWQATDLKLEQGGPRNLWSYSFNLVITETRGIAVTFNEIETMLYQPGVGSWSARYPGAWKLGAGDQFRFPLAATISCIGTAPSCVGPNVPIPLWRIVMQGTDARGQAVNTTIDLSLPPDPPAVPVKTSRSVREITLVPPKK